MGTYTWFHHTTEELSEFQSYVPYQEGYCHHIPRYAAACGPSSEMKTGFQAFQDDSKWNKK